MGSGPCHRASEFEKLYLNPIFLQVWSSVALSQRQVKCSLQLCALATNPQNCEFKDNICAVSECNWAAYPQKAEFEDTLDLVKRLGWWSSWPFIKELHQNSRSSEFPSIASSTVASAELWIKHVPKLWVCTCFYISKNCVQTLPSHANVGSDLWATGEHLTSL